MLRAEIGSFLGMGSSPVLIPADMFARKDDRTAFELQILMPAATSGEPSARDRATGFIRALLERGIAPESLAAGTELSGSSGRMHLRFLARERPANPAAAPQAPVKTP